jgi:transmembrane sensor
MSFTDERIAEAITEQALEWHMRHREGELSPAMKAAFMHWLRLSQLNVREYLEVAKLTGQLPEALADIAVDLRAEAQGASAVVENVVFLREEATQSAASRSSAWKWTALAAAVTALAIGAALYFDGMGRLGVMGIIPINAPDSDQRIVTLDDGSRLFMNSKSSLHVRFSEGERLIELQNGQVMFDVAHDWTRPFRVRAGAADIVAVGTRFDVNRRETGLTVTVVEGKVDVVDRLPAPVASGSVQPAMFEEPLRLAAGEQVEVGPQVRVAKAQEVDVRSATAWMHREIVFTEKSLADVTDELNRYLEKPIRIEDEALRRIRVSGIFNAYDMESFLAFLRQYDVDIDAREDVIYVRARPRAAVPAQRPIIATN